MALIRMLLLVLCTCTKVSGQIITTIAGTGRVEFSGDGGPAAKAGMNHPSSITTDKYGCNYVVDAGYNIVRKITEDGIIHTIIGSYQEERIHPAKGYEGDEGPASNAVLWKPRSIIIDNGNIYLGDFENSVIRKVTTAGLQARLDQDGGLAQLGFRRQVDPDGRVRRGQRPTSCREQSVQQGAHGLTTNRICPGAALWPGALFVYGARS